MNTTTVARYNFPQQAADSAVLRTAETGIRHTVAEDAATGTYTVEADRAPVQGDRVVASNPGGRSIEGTLVGFDTATDSYLVEWVGPWMMNDAKIYVGRFRTVAAV